MAAVETTTPLRVPLDRLSQSITREGHRTRGLNPLVGNDARLAEVLLRGEYVLHGFRNRDLRCRLFPDAGDPQVARRQSAQLGRWLRLFRNHSLIYRIRGTHRYQLTAEGRRLLPAFLAARNASAEKLRDLAA